MTAANGTDPEATKKAKGIQSIEIGYRVLLAVQRGPAPVQLSEIARRAGLRSGAARNYLVSLSRTGLVEQEHRGAYRLGPSAFALSLASFQQLSHYDLIRETTRRLHLATEANVAASVWSPAGPTVVFTLQAERALVSEFRTGLLPFLMAAAPQVFAAYLPEHLTLPLIGEELERRGLPREGAGEIRRRFAETVRSNGYATAVYPAELAGEVMTIAAPVLNQKRELVFALTIVDLTERVDPSRNSAPLETLLDVADQASRLTELTRT